MTFGIKNFTLSLTLSTTVKTHAESSKLKLNDNQWTNFFISIVLSSVENFVARIVSNLISGPSRSISTHSITGSWRKVECEDIETCVRVSCFLFLSVNDASLIHSSSLMRLNSSVGNKETFSLPSNHYDYPAQLLRALLSTRSMWPHWCSCSTGWIKFFSRVCSTSSLHRWYAKRTTL